MVFNLAPKWKKRLGGGNFKNRLYCLNYIIFLYLWNSDQIWNTSCTVTSLRMSSLSYLERTFRQYIFQREGWHIPLTAPTNQLEMLKICTIHRLISLKTIDYNNTLYIYIYHDENDLSTVTVHVHMYIFYTYTWTWWTYNYNICVHAKYGIWAANSLLV